MTFLRRTEYAPRHSLSREFYTGYHKPLVFRKTHIRYPRAAECVSRLRSVHLFAHLSRVRDVKPILFDLRRGISFAFANGTELFFPFSKGKRDTADA